MTQSRISSFFSRSITDADYQNQVERSSAEHSVAAQEETILRNERHAQKRLRDQQNIQQKRRPGRPRKDPATAASINITNTTTIDNSGTITMTASGNVNLGRVTIAVDSNAREVAADVFRQLGNMMTAPSSSSSSPSGSSSSSSSSSSPSPAPSSSSATSSSASAPSSSSSSSSSSSLPKKRERKDWVADYSLFAMIVNAVAVHREWKGAVRSLLMGANAGLFMGLNESTVRGWYDDGFQLKEKVRQRWQSRAPPAGRTGRPYLLDTVPEADAFIISTLRALRQGGSTVNSIVVASVMRSVLSVRAPELLQQLSISRRWCRSWLKRRLGWSYKKATTSGQKLPAQWQERVREMKLRVAATVDSHHITHPCFIINWDQTAVLLVQSQKYTYHHTKEKQVPVAGLEEKRQITAVVAGALSGELLPLQLIFAGQDRNPKQQKAVPTLDAVTHSAVQHEEWHLTQTHNHWSTLVSMQDYVRYTAHTRASRLAHL
jgi:hypothetical protein